MNAVSVDMAAWIARVNRDDNLHAPVVEVLRELHPRRARRVTTEFVLIAVADALSAPAYRQKTANSLQACGGWPS